MTLPIQLVKLCESKISKKCSPSFYAYGSMHSKMGSACSRGKYIPEWERKRKTLASGELLEGDLIIVADGANSSIRRYSHYSLPPVAEGDHIYP